MLLNEKVAIITGAGSGIGRASSLLFARNGVRVVVGDINEDAANETADLINNKGGKAIALKCNVACSTDVKNLVGTTIDEFGQLDILFNVAGCPQASKSIMEIEEEECQRIFDVNIKGTWLCVKYAYPYLKKSADGVILNIGSVGALRPRGGTSCYAASKGAIISLSRALAAEFAPEIRVCCINPGPTDTPMMKEFIPGYTEEDAIAVQAGTPLGKYVKPEDVAQLGLFLVSEHASKITGVEYNIDSGLFIGRGNR